MKIDVCRTDPSTKTSAAGVTITFSELSDFEAATVLAQFNVGGTRIRTTYLPSVVKHHFEATGDVEKHSSIIFDTYQELKSHMHRLGIAK